MYYAQLDNDGLCVGVSTLSDNVDAVNLVRIDESSLDYVWRKYINGEWSIEKFEPPLNNQPSEIEQLKRQLEQTSTDLQGFMDFYFTNTP